MREKIFLVYKNKYLVLSCYLEFLLIYGFWRFFVLFWGIFKFKRVG